MDVILTSALSCFEIFAGSSYRGSICPTGKKNWFELSGVSRNRGFEKSGFHCNAIPCHGFFLSYVLIKHVCNRLIEARPSGFFPLHPV